MSKGGGNKDQLLLINNEPLETDVDLADVFETIEPVAASWKRVGMHLRLPPSKLDQIEGEMKDCLMEMLKQWLNRNYDIVKHGEPSWRGLAAAVGRENGAVFKTIAEQHKVHTVVKPPEATAKHKPPPSETLPPKATPTENPPPRPECTQASRTDHPALHERPTLRLLQCIKFKNSEGQQQRVRPKQQLASKWRQMGTEFGFDEARLRIWDTQYRTDEERAHAVLAHWLDNGAAHYPLEWVGLLEMFEVLGCGDFAKIVETALIMNYKT